MTTPFDARVYAVVQQIPPGETRSYRWVAERVGEPGAARAIGQALKRNRRPDRVPCHRVIRADGSLGGYAWGRAAKRRLLTLEREGRLTEVVAILARRAAGLAVRWQAGQGGYSLVQPAWRGVGCKSYEAVLS